MDELIGIHVKRIFFHEPDFFLSEPNVESYLVDTTSGSCVKGNSSDSNSYASPFALTRSEGGSSRSPSDRSRLLVIDANFSDLGSESKLLVFEICKKVRRRKTQAFENKRIAWAFLVPLASDGSANTNQELKLQLYKVVKNCKVSHQDCNVYHLYSDHKRKKLHGYLRVFVVGVVPIKSKLTPIKQAQESDPPSVEKPNRPPSVVKTSPKMWKWSRLPSQTCRIPNKIHATHSLGKDGISCFRFSRKGTHVASAALSRIVVHEVVSGSEVVSLNGHSGFIYDLDWSVDDRHVLSVSSDCRGAIWSLHQKTPLFVLPHPSYVYCGRWLGDDRVVTGGRDHTLRFWIKNEGGFDLTEEILCHSGYVSTIATQGETLITGDSRGVIKIGKYTEEGFTLHKELSFAEISKNVIDSIHFHTSRRRVVLTARTRGSYLIDVVSGIILHTYTSGVNALARLMSCLTPCGSRLFTFCQNGDVGVWEVNTGRQIATYGNLFPIDSLTDLSGCIHYHPYEHMLGVAALGGNRPLLLLKYDLSRKDDSERLGLVFADNFSPRVVKPPSCK